MISVPTSRYIAVIICRVYALIDLNKANNRCRIPFSCEWELYKGTAPEQKTESDKNAEDLPSAFLNGWFVVVIPADDIRPYKQVYNRNTLSRLCAYC